LRAKLPIVAVAPFRGKRRGGFSTDFVDNTVENLSPIALRPAPQGFAGGPWGKLLSPHAPEHPFPHASPHAAVQENLRPPQEADQNIIRLICINYKQSSYESNLYKSLVEKVPDNCPVHAAPHMAWGTAEILPTAADDRGGRSSTSPDSLTRADVPRMLIDPRTSAAGPCPQAGFRSCSRRGRERGCRRRTRRRSR
jgi:hypothetical protein